jgi:hypothetical protein
MAPSVVSRLGRSGFVYLGDAWRRPYRNGGDEVGEQLPNLRSVAEF